MDRAKINNEDKSSSRCNLVDNNTRSNSATYMSSMQSNIVLQSADKEIVKNCDIGAGSDAPNLVQLTNELCSNVHNILSSNVSLELSSDKKSTDSIIHIFTRNLNDTFSRIKEYEECFKSRYSAILDIKTKEAACINSYLHEDTYSSYTKDEGTLPLREVKWLDARNKYNNLVLNEDIFFNTLNFSVGYSDVNSMLLRIGKVLQLRQYYGHYLNKMKSFIKQSVQEESSQSVVDQALFSYMAAYNNDILEKLQDIIDYLKDFRSYMVESAHLFSEELSKNVFADAKIFNNFSTNLFSCYKPDDLKHSISKISNKLPADEFAKLSSELSKYFRDVTKHIFSLIQDTDLCNTSRTNRSNVLRIKIFQHSVRSNIAYFIEQISYNIDYLVNEEDQKDLQDINNLETIYVKIKYLRNKIDGFDMSKYNNWCPSKKELYRRNCIDEFLYIMRLSNSRLLSNTREYKCIMYNVITFIVLYHLGTLLD